MQMHYALGLFGAGFILRISGLHHPGQPPVEIAKTTVAFVLLIAAWAWMKRLPAYPTYDRKSRSK
jgi:hypothetical protein